MLGLGPRHRRRGTSSATLAPTSEASVHGLVDVGFIKVRLASRVYGLGLSQQEETAEPGLARP
jgi:hypothetical protein